MLRHGRRASPCVGFTVVELAITLVIMGLVAALGFPRFAEGLRHTRVNQAAGVVAADLEYATSMSSRDRRPMVLEVIAGRAADYVVRDGASGEVRFRRTLGASSEFRVTALRFEPASVRLYPSGSTSGTLAIHIKSGNYSRHVTMTRAGFIRVLP